MRTSTVENELEGTLRVLDVNQKMDVLSNSLRIKWKLTEKVLLKEMQLGILKLH
jgi:hypothetical protein